MGTILVPSIPFSAFVRRRTQDIVAAGPYSLGLLDLRNPVTPPGGGGGGGGGDGGGTPPTVLVELMSANKLRNGSFDIFQRGSNVQVPNGSWIYTADGWVTQSDASQMKVLQVAGRGPTSYALQFGGTQAGVFSGTALLGQRIESQIANALGGQVCTFQAQIYNASHMGSGYPRFNLGHPTTKDTFTSPIIWDIQNIVMQSCPIGNWTRVSYTFVVPTLAAANGLFIMLDFSTNMLNTANDFVQITEADLQVTPSLSVGLQPSPPLPEYRSYAAEQLICLAYYEQWNGPQAIMSGFISTTTTGTLFLPFKTTMRKTPILSLDPTSLSLQSGSSIFSAASVTINSGVMGANTGPQGGLVGFSFSAVSGIVAGYGVVGTLNTNSSLSASAEL